MSMRLHRSNQSKLLRSTAADRCVYCGTPIEWFDRFDNQRIPLTPEVPALRVPERFRWHVHKGVAYAGTDPRARAYCRLPHPAVCPALDHEGLPPELADVVMRLGVRMHTRIARGDFVPALLPVAEEQVSEPEPEDADPPEGTRHIIAYSNILRLGPCRIEDIQCIATAEDGQRCPNEILVLEDGIWEQMDIPYAPGREGQALLSRSDGKMWVWSLKVDYATVTRWLKQRCTSHDPQASTAPDDRPHEWVAFHPLRHADYIVTERPDGYDLPPPDGITVHDGPTKRQQCAAPACFNATVSPVAEGWLCWRCAKVAKQRQRTHRRWQGASYGR
ncbi:DUF6083 domain-containing protein [Streptomyces sp. NPDC018031]|uniref:DUF6083 domain-containing protein n=1 Tax=Streptomyces sp. NPDC018031 TaxID=3365033 RepID=UPI00378CF755